MRTVQRTYTLFGIAELEDEARQKAYTDWLAKGNDYPYASENCDTLEAFCNLFRIVLHQLPLRQLHIRLPFPYRTRGGDRKAFGRPLAGLPL